MLRRLAWAPATMELAGRSGTACANSMCCWRFQLRICRRAHAPFADGCRRFLALPFCAALYIRGDWGIVTSVLPHFVASGITLAYAVPVWLCVGEKTRCGVATRCLGIVVGLLWLDVIA